MQEPMSESAKQRINVSDLVRDVAALLDEVEIDHTTFVVHRYGRPVAVLVPTDDSPGLRRRVRPRRSRAVPIPDVEGEAPDRDPEAIHSALEHPGNRLILKSIAAKGKAGWCVADGEGLLSGAEFAGALGSLELARLIRCEGSWCWATRVGMEQAALLEGPDAGG